VACWVDPGSDGSGGTLVADLGRVCVAVGQRATAAALAAQADDGVARNRYGLLAARAALAEADGAFAARGQRRRSPTFGPTRGR
jgi:hypothetical protein